MKMTTFFKKKKIFKWSLKKIILKIWKLEGKKTKKKIAKIWGKGGFSKIQWLEEKNIYIYIYLYFMFHIKFYRSKYIYIYIYTVTPFTKLNDLAVHKIKSNSERDEIYWHELERML